MGELYAKQGGFAALTPYAMFWIFQKVLPFHVLSTIGGKGMPKTKEFRKTYKTSRNTSAIFLQKIVKSSLST